MEINNKTKPVMKRLIIGLLIVSLFSGCFDMSEADETAYRNAINDFILKNYPESYNTLIILDENEVGFQASWVNDSCGYSGYFWVYDGGFYWTSYPRNCETSKNVKDFIWYERTPTKGEGRNWY